MKAEAVQVNALIRILAGCVDSAVDGNDGGSSTSKRVDMN